MSETIIERRNSVKTLVILLAGGVGARLYPLTRDRSKPAVPFGGLYRIIDFTLSNCINSGLRRIDVLTQYKSLSLQEHLDNGWSMLSREIGESINIIPPQQRTSAGFYLGTADAIYQNVYSLQREKPDRVLILSGDHIYKMDYSKMLNFHEQNRADLTVACIQVDVQEASRFGVMQVDADHRVVDFEEKPENPKPVPGHPDAAMASMGIYVFNTEELVRQVSVDARKTDEETSHDFGKNIIPGMIHDTRVFAYDFKTSPGGHHPYWRDIGTRDAYWQAHMDLLIDDPEIQLFDPRWPIRTYQEQCPPSRFSGREAEVAVSNSLISSGCVVDGAHIVRSVLSPRVQVGPGSEVSESVLMEDVVVGRGAKIHRAIIDKRVHVPDGYCIGQDPEQDQARFTMTSHGCAVLPKEMPLE